MNRPSTVDLRSTLTDPVLWAAVGLGLGLYLFYRGFGMLLRRRLILDTPRSTIRAAALGAVEISGKAVGPYTLISPLSAVNCYYYRARAWQSDQRRWKKVAEETLYAPFFLDDGSGRMLIDPRRAETDLPAAFSHEYSDPALSSEMIPDYISHFLHRHGISSESPLKLEECCILPGDVLFVLGTLRENPKMESAADRSPDALANAVPGFVSSEAADLQRRGELEFLDIAARGQLSSTDAVGPTGQFDLQSPVVLMKGPARDPFFISWCSQREVALTLQWQVFLYIWCGPVLTLAGLWLLIQNLTAR